MIDMANQNRTLPDVLLRQWKEEDLERYADMNADPEVMRFFPSILSRSETEASYLRIKSKIEENGWGLWAVEIEGLFAGFTGLAQPTFTAHFTPCVEIGWRFRKEYWGKGYAYAAALKAEAYAFQTLKLEELVSFTSQWNSPSMRLMERLGFTRDPKEDFDHPRIPIDHPICRHVLYRKNKKDWEY